MPTPSGRTFHYGTYDALSDPGPARIVHRGEDPAARRARPRAMDQRPRPARHAHRGAFHFLQANPVAALAGALAAGFLAAYVLPLGGRRVPSR